MPKQKSAANWDAQYERWRELAVALVCDELNLDGADIRLTLDSQRANGSRCLHFNVWSIHGEPYKLQVWLPANFEFPPDGLPF